MAFVPYYHLIGQDTFQCAIGSVLLIRFLVVLLILGGVVAGCWWDIRMIRGRVNRIRPSVVLIILDQCQCGAVGMKPACIVSTDVRVKLLVGLCTH